MVLTENGDISKIDHNCTLFQTFFLANSLVYPERIHRGIEWTSVFETLDCLSVLYSLWANFLFLYSTDTNFRG